MKKLGLFLACIMVVFATSGCGNKKLVCTSEEDDTKMEMKFNFDSEDKFEDGTVTMTMKAPEGTSKEELQESKEYFENIYKDHDAKIEIKNDSLVITMKMTKDNLDSFGVTSEEATYDSILKEAQESKDITCKKK